MPEQRRADPTAAKVRWNPLFALQWFFWGLPVLWRVGNWIGDLRYWWCGHGR